MDTDSDVPEDEAGGDSYHVDGLDVWDGPEKNEKLGYIRYIGERTIKGTCRFRDSG